MGANQSRKALDVTEAITDIGTDQSEVDLTDSELNSDSQTPEDIADKLTRHFIRAAQASHRARTEPVLLNSIVSFEIIEGSPTKNLCSSREAFFQRFKFKQRLN